MGHEWSCAAKMEEVPKTDDEDTETITDKDTEDLRCTGCGMPIIRSAFSIDNEIDNVRNNTNNPGATKRPRYSYSEFFRGITEPTNSDLLSGLKTVLAHRLVLTHKVVRKRWNPATNRCGVIKMISIATPEPFFVIHHAYEEIDEFHMLSDGKMETRRNRYGQSIWKLKVRTCCYHALSLADTTDRLSDCIDHIAACVIPFGMGFVVRRKRNNTAAIVWIRTAAIAIPSLEQLCARYLKRYHDPIDIVALLPMPFVEDGLFQIEWKFI